MSDVQLSPQDRSMLEGQNGHALSFAMEVVVRAAENMGAHRLVDVGFVHVDACHYYGQAHIDFAEFFIKHGAKFRIPAWTNTIPVSLVQPELREDRADFPLASARRLASQYEQLGCNPVWTCAPYQLPGGPQIGDHIVVGESNAVSYYNSVVGARTNKYSDFLDVCCGMTGRAPYAGLHCDEGRLATVGFDVSTIPMHIRESELFCHVLGIVMGREAGRDLPVIIGLPENTGNDSLKAIAAAGASSGGIPLYHAVGVTPEAQTLEAATGGRVLKRMTRVSMELLRSARASLSAVDEGSLEMVALGTPHFSITEFERAASILSGRRVADSVTLYISTSRFVADLARRRGYLEELENAGATVLVDTCTYFAPKIRAAEGRVMTNSAKWAYYAPGMLPVEVAFGSLEACLESAVAGRVCSGMDDWQ